MILSGFDCTNHQEQRRLSRLRQYPSQILSHGGATPLRIPAKLTGESDDVDRESKARCVVVKV